VSTHVRHLKGGDVRSGSKAAHAFRDLVECALDDDVSPSARDYGLDLSLLRLGHGELVKGRPVYF
jgi:hypothetical protein